MESASLKRQVQFRTRREANVLHPRLADLVQDYRARLSVLKCGYTDLTDWHPVMPEGWGEFPRVPIERAAIYKGSAETRAYSHHQAITRFGGRYVASWSSGLRHEDHVGQEVHFAWSEDGLHWSEPGAVVTTTVESRLVRHNAGLYATEDKVYCYVGVARDYGRDVSPPGMMVLTDQNVRLDVYESSDLKTWTVHENLFPDVYLYEGPRLTRGGKLLCCGYDITDNHAIMLVWDDPSVPAGSPRAVHVYPSVDGMKPEQGTWYQTNDGKIWMYQRDSSVSCRLGITWSDDEGETWTDLDRTDFPNTYSRACAGRLADGRYYIVGNNYDLLLDRMHLLIALSDDGYTFDRQYTLVEGDTTRRVNGRHKENGYHYPNCLADGDKLLVIYSVNKEDIEVGIVNTGDMV